MTDPEEKMGGSFEAAKPSKRAGMVAGVLLVLAVVLSIALFVVTRETPEKEPAEKIVKRIPEVDKGIRRPVPVVPEPEVDALPEDELVAPPPPTDLPEVIAPPPVSDLPEKEPPTEAKAPEAAKGRLFVEVDPAGAKIMVLNIKPPYQKGMFLEEGPYHILVSNAGYQAQKRWVTVKGGTDNTVAFRLERIVTVGTVFVDSEPPGAEWFLDGSPAGMTPGSKEAVEKGDHVITVAMDGYKPWSKTVSVRAGQQVVARAVLEEVGPMPGEVWREDVTGMDFVWIPEGCFQMGSPAGEAGRDADEGPVHEVCLDGFWMGKTEVTNGQYRRFKPAHDSKASQGRTLDGDSQPVVQVSWSDVTSFARWLSGKNNGAFSFRLPTEAEWEFACRAGSQVARFWGRNPDRACGFANVYDRTSKQVHHFKWVHHDCDDGYAVTSPVGMFQANSFGLHDMLGNVWEWCQDTYGEDAYRKHAKANPVHTAPGPFRVNRGGSWSDIPRSVRCAVRERLDPEFGNYYVGFRLVRMP
jgi:formylglycine-generating enzyme